MIEDIYPLTPLQRGMLFHTLQAEHNGPYVEQFVFAVGAAVDLDLFTAAWNDTVRRHPALRTAFVWEDMDEPHQAVFAHQPFDIERHDEYRLRDDERARRLTAFLDADRRRGFELHRAPLSRLTTFRHEAGVTLVWTLHHLILDGWSFPLVLRETAAAYRALAGGRRVEAPAAMPFRDFIAWLAERDPQRSASYWGAYLQTPQPATELAIAAGADEERRGSASDGRASYPLDAELSAAVTATAAAARVTVGTVFQAAWAATLARHNDAEAVTYGLTMAGRPADIPGVDGVVGPFITTVPRSAHLRDRQPVGDWLREIQQDRLDVEEHQHISLVDIRRYAGLATDESLFDTILVIENYPSTSGDYRLGPGIDWELTAFFEDTGYPLTVIVFPEEHGFRVQVLYDPAIHSAAAAETLLGRMAEALRSITTADRVVDVGVLGADERQRVLTAWNDTERDLDLRPVHLLVAEAARRTPEAIAIDDHGTLVTYAELEARAVRTAAALCELGVGPDTVVAILLRRSPELLVTVLAVLKAGGAYLALDPDHPDARLSYLLADSGAPVLVTEPELDHRLPEAKMRLLAGAPPAGDVTAGDVTPVDGDHLCYVTYTSGSTGRPKGIAMSHRAVANLNSWQIGHTSAPPGARTFAYASLSFDVSFQELFATWTTGGTLVLAGEDERTDFERLVRLAGAGRVQRWYLPAFALEQVAATADRLGVVLPDLVEVIPGSEPLHVTDEVRRLLAAAPGCRLENQYGPSECHVVTTNVLAGAPAAIPDHPHIGRPLANTRTFVLDRALRPVPIGVPGDLYLAGAGLARGYLGKPGLTASRFLPCPFPVRPGERMYHTGDRARLRADGGIEFLGRVDNQVKIRGFRIELGEVEALLREQPEIRESVVLLREIAGERRLVGYVLPAVDAVDVAALLDRMRDAVPEHLVPWTLVVLDAYPLTVNRKVDRAALPTPAVSHHVAAAGTEARTPAELLMTDLWARALGVSRVGLDDDFFQLGGHSLTAVRLTGHVRSAFASQVGVGSVFGLRTPRRLLHHIAEDLGGGGAVDAHARKSINAGTVG